MRLKFTKMNGAGNDFVMLDNRDPKLSLSGEEIAPLCDRHRGVGADGLLAVEPAEGGADFRMRYYNADGGEAEMCGNGARCFARFVREKKLTSKRVITVETATGVIELRVRNRQDVEVDMGAPEFEPAKIPFTATARAPSYPLPVDGMELEIGAISMGNPHAVLRVDNVDEAAVAQLGPLIEAHPQFPQRVNAGFMQVLSESTIKLRVFERGVGETLACGTGACAAVVYGLSRGWLRDSVTVELPGGKLSISWAGADQPVIMTGPTAVVFEGSIRI